jgi:hypothetical protein
MVQIDGWISKENVMWLPMLVARILFPILSMSCFNVLGLRFKSLIHFEFYFVYSERHGSRFSFLQMDISLLATIIIKKFISYVYFWCLVKNQMVLSDFANLEFSFLLHWSTCLLLCQNHSEFFIRAL